VVGHLLLIVNVQVLQSGLVVSVYVVTVLFVGVLGKVGVLVVLHVHLVERCYFLVDFPYAAVSVHGRQGGSLQ